MKIGFLGLMLGALLAGCVSTRNVSVGVERTKEWRGKTVALTSRPRADFVAMTAGKAAFGLIGAAAMIEAGNSIVEKNNIEDPAPILGQNLLSEAETQYSVVAAVPARVVIDTTDVSKMASAARGADLLLDVQSMGSQFRYFPADWSHYAVDSGFKVRLIDVRAGSLIAEGFCRQTTQKDPSPPTRDELLADGASRLKAILTTQREVCLQQLKANVLAIT
ncbi:MAG TPA: hypothetical protein VME42_08165 [Steroidobacteraceae bacterium]|nr:hypothetical protein [Steroidobacteraceae bacterium]